MLLLIIPILVVLLAVIGGLLVNVLKKSGNNKLEGVAESLRSAFLRQGMEFIENKKEQLKESVKNDVSSEVIDLVFNEGVSKLMPYVAPSGYFDSGKFEFGKDAYVITDDKDHPFQVNSVISETAKKITKGKISDEQKALAIYEWIEKSIQYGNRKLDPKYRYRTAPEVFHTKEGVCGEMAILYVVMARSVGLKSNFVQVDVDMKGDKVNHACASVSVDGIKKLADPAYHQYDVKHRKYEVISDGRAVEYIKSMRRK